MDVHSGHIPDRSDPASAGRGISRRSFLAAAVATGVIGTRGTLLAAPHERTTRPRARPVPTPSQLLWQRDELALFLHFGVNTFTGREWGDGTEDPAVFQPDALDARAWARAARAAGFRTMILTAKHHDGFCLWPTRTTGHSVASSPWRGGRGDVVRDLVDACRAEGLRAGLYCSPWDRNAPAYGDSPRYNDMLVDQLTELLSRYGPIHEVWFDGANGEGPNGRRQTYDWPRFWSTVRRHQPEAVIFSDAGPDVRWIGNEIGSAGDPNWSTVDPGAVPHPGAEGEGIIEQLQHGDPNGSVWRPGETDVSIRPGWFYRPEEDERVRTTENLVDLYFTSVGRNSKLLLNVPPTPAGLLHETDASRLAEMRAALDRTFAEDVAARAVTNRTQTGPRTAVQEIELAGARRIAVVDLREDIERGQSVSAYRVEAEVGGVWRTLAEGQTIGHRKLDRVEPVTARRIRLHVTDGWDAPPRVAMALWADGSG